MNFPINQIIIANYIKFLSNIFMVQNILFYFNFQIF